MSETLQSYTHCVLIPGMQPGSMQAGWGLQEEILELLLFLRITNLLSQQLPLNKERALKKKYDSLAIYLAIEIGQSPSPLQLTAKQGTVMTWNDRTEKFYWQ